MHEQLTRYFTDIIRQAGSFDMAKAEFEHIVADDPELRDEYAEWCEENGYSKRNGFDRFCQEYMDSQNLKMDSLDDFDE